MKITRQSLIAVTPLLCTFAGSALAQTASVAYSDLSAAPIPVLGNGAAVLLGLLLFLLGARSLRRNPGKVQAAVAALGLLTVATAGSWLASNAQAVVATTTYLLSASASPVAVTAFPAELRNDRAVAARIESIQVTGCPGATAITGTCSPALQLAANGGVCTLDSVCALSGTCGDSIVDAGEEYDPAPGPFSSAPVSAASCRYDFSAVSQFYCNGTCSISGSDGCDQSEADRFCKIKLDDPGAIASSFSIVTALAEPGFSCANSGLGTPIDMTSRGVTEPIAYQDSSILATHGTGSVIVNAVCVPSP